MSRMHEQHAVMMALLCLIASRVVEIGWASTGFLWVGAGFFVSYWVAVVGSFRRKRDEDAT